MPDSVKSLLPPGENILWFTQPHPHVYVLRGSTSILYGITWVILGSFWYHGSGGIGSASVFEGWWKLMPLATLPFILAGLSFFYYPFKMARKARRTWYVITSQRVFIAEVLPASPKPKLRPFQPQYVAQAQDRARWDKLHDVILIGRVQSNLEVTPPLDAGFMGIDDAEGAINTLKDHPLYTTKPSSA